MNRIHAKSPYIHTFSGNGLGDTIENWAEYQDVLSKGKFDLAIANPPFIYFDQASICLDGTKMVLPIEIRFLLKYIEIVKVGGYICIILPYGFLSLDLYSKLRLSILKKVTIHKVIKIFENCFERIDADTCLLLLQKKNADDEYIQDEIAIEYLDNHYSRPENILIGRVGKACIGKIAMVPKHYHKTVTSDCLFCLEIKEIDPYYLTLYLASKYGQIQLKGLAKGSCSKYITKENLLQVMIIVPKMETQIYFRRKYLDILSRRGRTNKVTLLQELVCEMENIIGEE